MYLNFSDDDLLKEDTAGFSAFSKAKVCIIII